MAESSRHSAGTRWRDWLYRATDPLADATVAVCQAVVERHVASGAVRRGKLRVIPSGVDTERFRPDAARRDRLRGEFNAGDEFVWLAAGRLMWKKDYPAMPLVPDGARRRGGPPPRENTGTAAACIASCRRIVLGRLQKGCRFLPREGFNGVRDIDVRDLARCRPIERILA